MSKSRPVSNSRLERKLRAIAGVQGGAILQDVTDVAPLLTLEADRPEWMYAGGEELKSGQAQAAAGGAANVSLICLTNPAGSGVILVVTRISAWCEAATASRAQLAWIDPALAVVGGNQAFRDGRLSTVQVTSGIQVQSKNDAPSAVQVAIDLWQLHKDTRTGVDYKQALVVPEGSRVAVYPVTVLSAVVNNTDFAAAFSWYQKPLEGGKLG